MKKQKSKQKTAEQIAKEEAEKRAEKLQLCWIEAEKLGKASPFHFLRIIKKAVGCEDAEAERLFSGAVSAGKIKEAGRNLAGDVGFYEVPEK